MLTQKETLLSDLLRQSLSFDLLTPVLTEAHLLSMDRRLRIVLQTVDKCIQEHGTEYVLVDNL